MYCISQNQTKLVLNVQCSTILQSFKILLLTEKVEHLKEEKTSSDTQLSVANSTTQQLQRDNANVVADLAELRRKLTTVQEVRVT